MRLKNTHLDTHQKARSTMIEVLQRQRPILVFVRRRAGFLFGDEILLDDYV